MSSELNCHTFSILSYTKIHLWFRTHITNEQEKNLSTSKLEQASNFYLVSQQEVETLSIYNIQDITTLLNKKVIELLFQLLQNETTSPYIYNLLHLQTEDRKYSFLQDILSACHTLELDIIDLIIHKQFKLVNDNELPQHDDIDICKNCITNWHNCEDRSTFKRILEHYVRQ